MTKTWHSERCCILGNEHISYLSDYKLFKALQEIFKIWIIDKLRVAENNDLYVRWFIYSALLPMFISGKLLFFHS